MSSPSKKTTSGLFPSIPRRVLLAGAGVAGVGLAGAGVVATGLISTGLIRSFFQKRTPVFIARNQKYEGGLEQTITDGLVASGIELKELRGKLVLLKPNLVEPTRACPHMTTHPQMILAAAEVFRRAGALVTVGEGPGHVRDTDFALIESGVAEVLDSAKLSFADLNYQEVGTVKNAGRASKLPGFYFPQAVMEADLIVSMPKLKTHHWVGMTGAMKNLYGVIPGIKYGWPKNVLHHNGIPQTVFDINASLPRTIAIVDGIDCMEGDGPIMGTKKAMGLVLVGANPTAVDATICRLMQIDPREVAYLKLAENHLGPLAERLIDQRGEAWRPLSSPFQIVDKPHLRRLRPRAGELIS